MRRRNPPPPPREEGVPSPVPEVVSDVDDNDGDDDESDRTSYDGEEKLDMSMHENARVDGEASDQDQECDPLTRTFLIFCLFLVGMTVTGCRPITLRWAKNGNEKYPFMIATWVVVVKFVVILLSLLMYILTEHHKRQQAWNVADIKLNDIARVKNASRKGKMLPELTPRRPRSDSWSSSIVVVHGGGSVPGTRLIPSPLLRAIRRGKYTSTSTAGTDGFRLATTASLESTEQGTLGSLSSYKQATESTRLLTRRSSTPSYERQNTGMSSYSTRYQQSNDAVSVSSTQSELLLREYEMCGSDEQIFRKQVFEEEMRSLNGGIRLSAWERFSMSRILLLPVCCSVISDILAFYMFEHVSPSTYSIVKQVRLLFCSLMYRFALNRQITPVQWMAVGQLILASALFEIRFINGNTGNTEHAKERSSYIIGFTYLFIKVFFDTSATILSDAIFKHLSGRYFPFPEQQLYFAVYSFILGLVTLPILSYNDLFVQGRPFFDGYNNGAYVSIVLYAFYGVLISLLLRFADSMVKMFQALFGVMITIWLDHHFFGSDFGPIRKITFLLVMSSIIIYKMPS